MMRHCFYFIFFTLFISACTNNNSLPATIEKYDEDVLQSIIINDDSLKTPDFVNARLQEMNHALLQPIPILLCRDSLSLQQKLAQSIAIKDSIFTQHIRNADGLAYRCEIFGVYPARESDMAVLPSRSTLKDCYRVEMYNYATNTASTVFVDNKTGQAIGHSFLNQTQPDLPLDLKNLAIKIAIASPEVQQALGMKPSEKDALMASTKTALNRSRCERSRHLCVAPTFVKEGKALWAIVDLTDYRVAGIRWTNTGAKEAVVPITERKLQDDKITACFCDKETDLQKDGWAMKYMLTSSDGLRVSQVSFDGNPILQSAKLVDWHVSYSGTDGFGYSDAVGCPYFSQAAVVALNAPKIATLKDGNNRAIGFVLEQTFKSEGWPGPCNYNYRQRFEFYKDGKFRIAAASIGRGCGNDGTYRPVFRIAFAAASNSIAEWAGHDWANWKKERWQLQNDRTIYSSEGYQYKLSDQAGKGFYVEPGRGQFGDGGRGDNAYLYVTKNSEGIDEGEADMVTIGPCCNTDYHQGPEKFIEPVADNIQSKKLVLWYVAQLKNDDTKGQEYCWAESVLEQGVYTTKVYPCFCGPMFIPIKSTFK